MNISSTDAQNLFTKMLIDVYEDSLPAYGFLRSFFPNVVSATKELSIEVQRAYEKVAIDQVRGSDGQRNSFSKSTEKIFVPPYFREFFDATQLSLYDRLYGATSIDDAIFAQYINSVAECIIDLQEKIERAYEVQCAQVLQTGIVTMVNGDNIDFKRKPASIVDPGSGQYWANDIDLYAQLQAGCNFLRQVGKSKGSMFNLVLGSTAMNNLKNNAVFLKQQNLFHMALDTVAQPQRDSTGAASHGILTVGDYQVRLWTYPQYYDDANNVSTPYLDPKLVTLLPETPRFKMGFAGTPQLIEPGTAPVMGAFIFGDYIDKRGKSHIYDVESAGIPVPIAVDQMYTLKAVA